MLPLSTREFRHDGVTLDTCLEDDIAALSHASENEQNNYLIPKTFNIVSTVHSKIFTYTEGMQFVIEDTLSWQVHRLFPGLCLKFNTGASRRTLRIRYKNCSRISQIQ